MSTLADPNCRTDCHTRLARLTATTERKWGRMTAHQMVCHLNDSFAVAAGKRNAGSIANPLSRTLVKWIALRTPMRWPHGTKTLPEVEQGAGGTPPSDWDRDCAQLSANIAEFADHPSYAAHPMFGDMSQRDWHTWGYRHVDHHFRQFGV
jgi:Protein of unknown function (DUF1569)